jgi:hypothetical protein
MFEHHRQPVIAHHLFLRRMMRSVGLAASIIGASLLIGVLGYHFIAQLAWIDAFHNAAMILSGMGPVDEIRGNGAKIFAGSYAVFSGVVFLSTAAVLFAPIVHRLLHRLHALEEDETKPRSSGKKS